MMLHKFIKLSILCLIVFLMTAASATAENASNFVGVRVPQEYTNQLISLNLTPEKVIDYGSFLWAIMPVEDLQHLVRENIPHQITQDPYTFSLGSVTFDPLITSPNSAWSLDANLDQAGPDLFLVQFHGPIKPEWLAALESEGLTIVQYIHPYTYVVWGDSDSLERSKQEDLIRWVGAYLPEYVVQPNLRSLNQDSVLVRVMIVQQADGPTTLKAIESLGGRLIGVDSEIDPVFFLATLNMPGDIFQAVAALPGVYSIQPVPTDGGDRGEMSNQITAGNYDSTNQPFPGYLTWLNAVGLTGSGVIIANVDSGINDSHPDLTNRMLPCSGTTCGGTAMSNHGTHTAGIMAGDASSGVTDSFGFLRGLGMAPGAQLIEQVYSPTYTEVGGMLTLMTQSYRNNADISGNSWGPSGTPKGYDLDTRLVDIGVRDADPDEAGNQPLSYILSIMNGEGGTSSQGTPDEAKNIFTIGSTYMQYSNGTPNPNIHNLSANSAHGPALDGRKIPHLVAPGWCVDSTYVSTLHANVCGTSMASPHVSGAAALFYERYRNLFVVDPSPALVKAAFLPVAHSLAGNLDADGNTLGHPFDSKQGWGRVDASAVLDPSDEVLYFDQQTRFEATGESWSYTLTIPDHFKSLRAMLVWTDAPGHGSGGSAPAWVNDLDLSIIINGQTYYGNNFGTSGYSVPGGSTDYRNNTEGIFLPSTSTDTCTITVTAANIAGDGVPNVGTTTDQDFALVVYYTQELPQHRYIFPIFFH